MRKEVERVFCFASGARAHLERATEEPAQGEPILDRLSPVMKSAFAEELYFDCSNRRRAELWEEYARKRSRPTRKALGEEREEVSIWEDFLAWLSGVERAALLEKAERRFGE